ncbi:YpmS family protein [Carnobacterium funditum]|uniref:YpmS family protein n=1 Tax=Carnobacterium funditum TaxID=2752 RepID=UPI0005514599|nr:YpmS family protein [Carnobacterium funditum]
MEEKSEKNRLNYWKWAFLLLLSIVLGSVIWLSSQLTPFIQGEPNLSLNESKKEEMTFQIQARKKDLNQLVTKYIDEELSNKQVDFNFILDEQAQLSGTFQLFSRDVGFSLFLDPFVMENGNLQFKATRISVGALDLPISFAMNLIKSQLKVPEWVAIDTKKEIIVFNLNEFYLKSGMHFTADKIDLEKDDIRLNVFLPNN